MWEKDGDLGGKRQLRTRLEVAMEKVFIYYGTALYFSIFSPFCFISLQFPLVVVRPLAIRS